MGNECCQTQSQPELQTDKFQKSLQKSHIYLCDTFYDRSIPGKIYQKVSEELVLLVLKAYSPSLHNSLQLELTFQHPNLLPVVDLEIEQSEEPQIGVFHQWLADNLSQQFYIRKEQADEFTEEEIWVIVEAVAGVLEYLQEQNTYHGDIQMMNVFLNKNGKVYIGSFRFLRQNENICDMVLNNSQYYNCNFSPEQLEYIAQNQEKLPITTSSSVLSQTSQIFQLGFLLLQLCCLSPLTEIYKLDTLQIYNSLIQSSLEQCSHKYSYRLIALLRNLLQYDPIDRINVKGVMEVVRKVDVKERRIRMLGKEESQRKRQEAERDGSERAKEIPDLSDIQKRLQQSKVITQSLINKN